MGFYGRAILHKNKIMNAWKRSFLRERAVRYSKDVLKYFVYSARVLRGM